MGRRKYNNDGDKIVNIHSTEFEHAVGAATRDTRVKNQRFQHLAAIRKPVLQMFNFYREQLMLNRQKLSYTEQEQKVMVVKYIMLVKTEVHGLKDNTNNTIRRGDFQNELKSLQTGAYRVPDLGIEDSVMNLLLWDGTLGRSQNVVMRTIQVPDIMRVMQAK